MSRIELGPVHARHLPPVPELSPCFQLLVSFLLVINTNLVLGVCHSGWCSRDLGVCVFGSRSPACKTCR